MFIWQQSGSPLAEPIFSIPKDNSRLLLSNLRKPYEFKVLMFSQELSSDRSAWGRENVNSPMTLSDWFYISSFTCVVTCSNLGFISGLHLLFSPLGETFHRCQSGKNKCAFYQSQPIYIPLKVLIPKTSSLNNLMALWGLIGLMIKQHELQLLSLFFQPSSVSGPFNTTR